MKKKCNYCGNMAKITIIHNDDNIRGSYCDLCGNFIEIPEKTKPKLVSSTSYRSNRPYSRYSNIYRKKAKRDIIKPIIKISIIILLIILIFQIFFVIFPSDILLLTKPK